MSEVVSEDKVKSKAEKYCVAGIICGLLSLFIAPIIFGPLGIILGHQGAKLGAVTFGRATAAVSAVCMVVSILLTLALLASQ